MIHPIFKKRDSTHRDGGLERGDRTEIRIAHWTDLHIPGERNFSRRLRDLIRRYESPQKFSYEISALSNEMSHPFRNARANYNRLIRKTLVGLKDLNVDYLIVTGDIGHCGIPAEFAEFDAALQATGWRDVAIVAGNHDRFNVYAGHYDKGVDDFFDVVSPGETRFWSLNSETGVFELDSNRLPGEVVMEAEHWLPNATGIINEAEIAELKKAVSKFEGRRLLVLLHHHVSEDWYIDRRSNLGGLMSPVEGGESVLDFLSDQTELDVWILHGHRHLVMPVGYEYQGLDVSCPGAFFEKFRLNLLDIESDGKQVLTQLQLRKD